MTALRVEQQKQNLRSIDQLAQKLRPEQRDELHKILAERYGQPAGGQRRAERLRRVHRNRSRIAMVAVSVDVVSWAERRRLARRRCGRARPGRAATAMGFDEARHLLSRATFGATPAEIRAVEAMDYARPSTACSAGRIATPDAGAGLDQRGSGRAATPQQAARPSRRRASTASRCRSCSPSRSRRASCATGGSRRCWSPTSRWSSG